MSTDNFNEIPLAILIFDKDGQISYRAYSPIDSSREFEQFLDDVYNCVSYDSMNYMNGTTYGMLKEIHTRNVSIPLGHRNETCHFMTYSHPLTQYKPIHRQSPVFFDSIQAQSYATAHNNLYYCKCSHEFV